MRKTLVIMTGAPGSGKSTIATQYKKEWIEEGLTVEVISRDSIRFDLLRESDAYFQHETEVVKKYHKKLVEAIKDPWVDIIIADSTNINQKSRARLIELALEADPEIYLLSIAVVTNPEVCKKRNAERTGRAHVPDDVIDKMARQMELPSKDEGFDDIWLK